MNGSSYDLVVIGGGINGVGIAADAAGRGLRVLLAEAADLAGATSSASSKLIHGGLRYLEQYAFRLVREALSEREILLAKAPHIIWPMRFVLPHDVGMRSAPLLRAGLFLYDHLSTRRSLGGSSTVDLATDPAGEALAPRFTKGFTYWDCWVDDARLVVLNAMAARANGAEILTRTAVTALEPIADGGGAVWRVTISTAAGSRVITARAVVNAAGPWVADVARLTASSGKGGSLSSVPQVRMVKGSHIVVPRIRGADEAYIFQNVDGRVVFALPYESAFTLIGTTDSQFSGDPRNVSLSADDQAYLLAVAARYFRQPLTAQSIVWSFAGVRPLDDDGSDNPSAVSRDYRLQLVTEVGPPLLQVIGGKITTYRRLAEAALEIVARFVPMGKPWTATAPLPGGDVGPEGYDAWFRNFASRYPRMSPSDLSRLARRYGTRAESILGDACTIEDLGRQFGGGLSAAEVSYLKREEWAMTADDVLWRRTKSGLHLAENDRQAAAERVQRELDRV
jgi:glycerol-3-phosphate dehydrogenase